MKVSQHGFPSTCDEQTRGEQQESVADHRRAGRFVSHLWSTHLAEALPWRPLRRYTFKRPSHIDVLESHAYKTLMRAVPMHSRFVVFQDSMVCLGASAKGRSSSNALNRVLRQSMALQLAKNRYPVGHHTPTWALRADDPSRARAIRAPRTQLPHWFLQLRLKQVSCAQDSLDGCSGTSRALGRWLLFLGSSLLVASGNFTTVRDWAEASTPAQRQAGSGAWQGYRSHCQHTAEPQSAGLEQPNTDFFDAGGIWPLSLRERGSSKRLCRNHQRDGPKVPLHQDVPHGPMAAADDLTNFMARKAASSDAAPTSEGAGGSYPILGVDTFRHAPLDRLFCLVATLRTAITQSRGLHGGSADRTPANLLHPADVGEVQDSRSSRAKCQARRALRDSAVEETIHVHVPSRKDLVLLHFPFPDQAPGSF